MVRSLPRSDFSPRATLSLCYARVMDRNILLQHLAQTERHIAEGEEHLAQQTLLIEKLERHGHDSEDARALLKTMIETQALHKQDRDRVLKELFAPSRPHDAMSTKP